MARQVVPKCEEFDISPTGVIHRPTGATWTAYRDSIFAHMYTRSMLGSVLPNGDDYKEAEVEAMAKQLLARRFG